MVKRIFVYITLSLISLSSLAQHKSVDVGVFAGVASQFGDMTKINYPQSLAPAAGVYYRHNFNTRLALKANLGYSQLNLDGNLDNIVLNDQPNFVDNKSVISYSLQFQVNFLNYKLGSQRYKFSPYMALGIGGLYYDVDLFNPTYDPAALPTSIDSRESLGSGNTFTMTIPLSLGVNYNLGKKWAVGLEWNLQKVFADHLDNLDDPHRLEASDFMHNNDWYTSFGVTVSYLLFLGKNDCPAYDF
ncbi:hypothetical protein EYV94_08730 [Puteibacter caeruleilacunae]|nr:hypothetical protein EYV94_08730 [Puteibacter caeruleilacunae]